MSPKEFVYLFSGLVFLTACHPNEVPVPVINNSAQVATCSGFGVNARMHSRRPDEIARIQNGVYSESFVDAIDGDDDVWVGVNFDANIGILILRRAGSLLTRAKIEVTTTKMDYYRENNGIVEVVSIKHLGGDQMVELVNSANRLWLAETMQETRERTLSRKILHVINNENEKLIGICGNTTDDEKIYHQLLSTIMKDKSKLFDRVAAAIVHNLIRSFADTTRDRVFFSANRSTLEVAAESVLDLWADWLASHPDFYMRIEGHADNRGSAEHNFMLARQRATTARDYLITKGIAPSRLAVVSFGAERPAMLGSTEAAWATNRRVVGVVY